jgi:hypothetical protein
MLCRARLSVLAGLVDVRARPDLIARAGSLPNMPVKILT